MFSSRSWTRVVRNSLVATSLAAFALLSASTARAEKVLFKDNDWEVYTDGRVGGFFSYVNGDGFPQPPYVIPAGGGDAVPLHAIKGGGWYAPSENHLLNDPSQGSNALDQGTVNMMRVRSGFVANILGFGVRNQISPRTKVTAYLQFWSFIESINRQKNQPNYADVRQGYVKLESFWGSVLVGRTRTLFSRGATDINAMYAHRWGVGFPNVIESNGPTLGNIGFGVLGSGFAAGIIYGTPTVAGFHLDVGLFDPIALTGVGVWPRTEFVRPEAELNWEYAINPMVKVAAFGNGAVQKVAKAGYCPPPATTGQPCELTAWGFGYGARLEVGPVHIGFAGHRGTGLGLTYALEQSDAAQDQTGALRTFDGYYGQAQVVLGPVDVFAGGGITRVFLNDVDKTTQPDPRDPTQQVIATSVIKNQIGINAGAVWHFTPNLHIDLDYFRAQANWYLGEQQTMNIINSGMTFNW